jgi:DNA-binding SARP family transcriptional activator/tetratricopeptide (TPR) repeat protein
VRVLGGLVVEGLSDRDLGSRKGRQLMKVLLTARGTPVSTGQLAEALWGDEQPAQPVDQVGVLVSRLRSVLGADRLPRTDGGYALVPDWLDLDELEERVREARDALAVGRLGAAFTAAEAGVMLARGEVLPEEDGEWVEAPRAAARLLVIAARRTGAEAASRAGNHAAAAVLAQGALIEDPFDEVSLRILMRAHGASGRPSSGLAVYAAFRSALAEELGVSPCAETEEVHRELLDATDRPAVAPEPTSVPSAFAGRGTELSTLGEVFARVSRAGTTGVAVVVTGEAGIGKTALAQAWAGTVATRALVLVGRCDPLGGDLPLQPIVDTLAEFVGGLATAEERALIIGSDDPTVAALLGLSSPATGSAATVLADVEVGRARLFSGLVEVLTRLAGGRPVVLVLDDLQDAGSSTISWLAFALRRMPHLLVVATALTDHGTLLPGAQVLALGPLDRDAVAAIVGLDRAEECHRRSGGNPLLVRALADVDEPVGVEASSEEAPGVTVAAAVERRLRGLDSEQVATVRAAAVLGSDVDLDLLADVCGGTGATMLDRLEAAVARGLVAEVGAGVSFRHELERSALAASAGSARRALVHREAARVLAQRPAVDPLVVAVHARLGGDTDTALVWYVRAAAEAVARFDLAAAEAHLDAGLAIARSAEAYIARARIYMATLRFDEATLDARRALAEGGGAAALEAAGWAAYYRRDYAAARAFADEGVDRSDEPSLRVSCLALGGRVRHGAGDLGGALTQLEAAETVENATAQVRGLAHVWQALARLHQGRPDIALDLLRRVLVDPDRMAHPFAALHARFGRLLACGQLGLIPEALAAATDTVGALDRAGAAGVGLYGPITNGRAWILRWCGASGEADELNLAAVEATSPTGPRAEAFYAGRLDLADGRLLAGDPAGAAAIVDQLAAIEAWQGTMAWHQRHRWRLLHARLAIIDGRRDMAAELAADVASDASSRGARRYALIATAVGALAGGAPSADLAALDDVVVAMGGCAALDGWSLVHALGRQYDVAAWRSRADASAEVIVRTAPSASVAASFVARQLG